MNKQTLEEKAVELAKGITPPREDITPVLEVLL